MHRLACSDGLWWTRVDWRILLKIGCSWFGDRRASNVHGRSPVHCRMAMQCSGSRPSRQTHSCESVTLLDAGPTDGRVMNCQIGKSRPGLLQ